jgi:bifunctional UDP-N-acetylglucosamine pyrophosphorylase / glucosamine-1-phosphate N-acetyltransferase
MPRVAPTVLIMAAGQGTRMRSGVPKVLHPLCGRPMLLWPIAAAREAGAGRIVVIDGPGRALAEHLPDDIEVAVQEEPRGTGDAVRSAAAQIDRDATVIVLSGDVPLVTAACVRELAERRQRKRAAAVVLSVEIDDPAGYGRVVRDGEGDVLRIVETKVDGDARASDLAIREINTGIYAFEGGPLLDALEQIEPANAQGEYYLPDVLPAMRDAGHTVTAHRTTDTSLVHGVNDRAGLAYVRALAQARIHQDHLHNGVTIVDPRTTLIDAGVTIGQDTVIEPSTFLRGDTAIGERATVGPLTTVIDAKLGDEVSAVHSYLVGCEVHDRVSVGPFAYLRPGTVVRAGAKVGTFVEVKNSDIGEGSKVPHLSYLGDTDVGEGSNLGAGTITANYDGEAKHRTTIGARVHGGVDTSLVAPVTVGDDVWIAAGSVITDDVPDGALAVARERQRNVEGYDERKRSDT